MYIFKLFLSLFIFFIISSMFYFQFSLVSFLYIYILFFPKPPGLFECGYYQLPIFVLYILDLISVCTERSIR